MLRPRINGNIKILTAILLAGFTLFNIVFISYAADEIIRYNCPAGTQAYYATDVDKLTTAEAILRWIPGLADIGVKPTGCISTYKIKADGTRYCENSTKTKYDTSGTVIGCFADATAIKATTKITVPQISEIEIQKYTTYSEIPCQPGFGGLGGTCPKAEEGPAQYLVRLYQFGLMIAGLAAFGSIVYGSLKYILSAGNIGSTEEAKDIIRQAIYGLVLLLGAYLILYTINPNLVNLRNPDVSPLDIASVIKKGALPDEQRLPPSSNEEHPLCQSGVGSGLTVQSNIKFEGPISTLVGGEELPSEVKGFVCLKCKANAVKSSVSDCECLPTYKLSATGNQCVLAE